MIIFLEMYALSIKKSFRCFTEINIQKEIGVCILIHQPRSNEEEVFL